MPVRPSVRAGMGAGCAWSVPPRAGKAFVHPLFPTLTGLADGLALKELRYAAEACDSPHEWVPRSPRYMSGDSAEGRGMLAEAPTDNAPLRARVRDSSRAVEIGPAPCGAGPVAGL